MHSEPVETGREPGATDKLVDLLAALKAEDLDENVRRAISRHLLDTLGALIAGSNGVSATIAARTLASTGIFGSVRVPGISGGWDPLSAAYLMGASAHGLELDDGFRAGSVHPGAPVIPALLAASRLVKVDGARMGLALTAGYEVVTRVAAAIHPTSRLRGFHNTPVAGALGAAAACAVLLNLDRTKLAHAIGIAASSAAGIFAFINGGGEIKRLHPGHAAREGLFAALLARDGMTGPRNVIEIEDGMLQAFGSGGGVNAILDGLGSTFGVTRCYIKPYAACRHIHPALDAVSDIVARNGLDAEAIERIDIGTYAIAEKHARGQADTMASAQLNYQYCVALVASGRKVLIEDFDAQSLKNPVLTGLAGRVHVVVDQECDADYPRLRVAKVRVTTKTGEQYETRVDTPRGSPENPLSEEEVETKFLAISTPVIGADHAEAAKQMVASLFEQDDASALLNVCTGLDSETSDLAGAGA